MENGRLRKQQGKEIIRTKQRTDRTESNVREICPEQEEKI